jgi:thioredoxin-like negative regulator of GroEL
VWIWSLAALMVPAQAWAGHVHFAGGDHHGRIVMAAHRGHRPGGSFGGGGGGFGFGFGFGYGYGYGYGLPYYVGIGPYGPMVMSPPWSMMNSPFRPIMLDRGLVGGPMPPPLPAAAAAPKPARIDAAKGSQLVTIGDRLFRAGNLKRAVERYEQAVRADPSAAAPRVRLAQVALARDQFAEAATQLREAVAAEPGWLLNAPDIQSVYGEPADFTRQIAKLESHLQVNPGDRDAWLVLGAELYLSGQTRRSADVFVRLTDRKPDATLAAFLDASSMPRKDAK